MEETFSSLVHPLPPPFSTPRLPPATRAVPRPNPANVRWSLLLLSPGSEPRTFVCPPEPGELVLELGCCP